RVFAPVDRPLILVEVVALQGEQGAVRVEPEALQEARAERLVAGRIVALLISRPVAEDCIERRRIRRVEARVVAVVTEDEEVSAYERIRPRVGEEVALDLERCLAVIVLGAEGHVAAAVVEVRSDQCIDTELVAIAGLGDAVLNVELEALEI